LKIPSRNTHEDWIARIAIIAGSAKIGIELIDMTGAYSFICKESSTDALCARLNGLGGWQWWVGDSYWYGDYVACKPFPGVRIRIVDFPKQVNGEYQYDADVRIRGECNTPMTTIDEAFRGVLAQIGAHSVQEIESFD
jgi:hypothetical protein